ncbi:protein of unknown function [Nakamurella panacisegetis]|uniref:DUF4439 domain-containing protein n=1 Tax=Nakamurella panacisegetis TaxID=1090615 RepID=A0A1H0SJZ7_9ACTN|nr:ferritin-like domain-containing protein [Nakamurella panacisegetis]SDP42037.1 protein of unknown function [Nakamurella panacisegetis]
MTTPAAPTSGPSSARPTAAAPATKLASETAKALQTALAAEQVAVWAYDLVAAYDPADASLIATIRTGHLARRDATASLLVSGGSTAPIAAPAYSIPKPVTDVASARALSTTVETDCAAAWRVVIGSTDSTSLRTSALAGLSDSAVWLTQMKMAARTVPVTVALPGVS